VLRVLRTLGTLASVLVALIGGMAIVIAAASHFTSEGEATVFGHPMMVVLSGSMAPAIATGDIILDNQVSRVQAEHLHVGQIISFFAEPGSQTVITHRIVAVTSVDGQVAYVTKGIANNAPDASPRLASQVIGTYAFRVPRGGYMFNALHRPLVLGLLLASPVLWFFSSLLFQWARETDEQAGREPADGAGEAGGGTP